MEYIQHDPKDVILNLEVWIRSLINKLFVDRFGENYINAKFQNENVFNNSLKKHINERFEQEPDRFSRKIDTLTLEQEKGILCNQKVYKEFFKNIFNSLPNGNETLRFYLDQLNSIRNKLFHANPISQREYEKAICYSHDIIDLIREYYRKNDMQEMIVPTITFMKDSLGNQIYRNNFLGTAQNSRVSQNSINSNLFTNNVLYIGDTCKIEIKVDETFSTDDYSVEWTYFDGKDSPVHQKTRGNILEIKLNETQINQKFLFVCKVKTKKDYHKYNNEYDDMLAVQYNILPNE